MLGVRRVLTLVLTIVPLVLVSIFLLSWTPPCHGVTELCNPNKSRHVYQFTADQCPFGVLFATPIKAECLKSSADNDQANFYADLCDNVKYEPDVSKQIQLISAIADGELSEKESCKGTEAYQCDLDIIVVENKTITEPGDDTTMSEEVNYDEPPEVTERRNDSAVLAQTLRIMKFLAGLEGESSFVERQKRDVPPMEGASNIVSTEAIKNYDNEGPILRVTELLKLSFKVLSKHCDPGYVSKKFNREVQRAFLFLLRETDTSQLEDVTEQEYKRIKKALDDCLAKDLAFSLNGTACRSYAKVKRIEKNGQTMIYRPDEFSYNPHLYDIPIDATWGTSDFVHGLCYGTFKEHINSHHLYQRAIERLFGEPILYRWNRPPVLHRPEIWNHVLSANVRLTLKNLDVCIHAAYYDTPFMHRLERPLVHYVPKVDNSGSNGGGGDGTTGRRRRRRNAPVSLDDTGLSEAGWCFQEEADQRNIVRAYIEANCPESPAVEQFQEIPTTTPEPEPSELDGDEEYIENSVANPDAIVSGENTNSVANPDANGAVDEKAPE